MLHAIEPLRTWIIKERIAVRLGAVVVVDSVDETHGGFDQACWVLSEHKKVAVVKRFDGAVYVFGSIAVVRGVGRKANSYGYQSAVGRLLYVVENIMRESRASGLVWHECSDCELLARTLETLGKNKDYQRITFRAISMTSGLAMDEKTIRLKSGMQSSSTRKLLLRTIQRLNIPLLLIDKCTLSLDNPYTKLPTHGPELLARWSSRANRQPYISNQWPRLLPRVAWTPIIKFQMDDLCVELYRLRASTDHVYESRVSNNAKKELTPSLAKTWAKRAIDAQEYTRSKCHNSKARADALVTIGRHVEAPMDFPLDAFVGTLVDPGRAVAVADVTALRVDVDWTAPAVRVNSDSLVQTYILLSKTAKGAHAMLLRAWADFITPYTLLPLASVPLPVATSWRDLQRLVEIHMGYLCAAAAGKKWTVAERDLAKQVLFHAVSGSMARLCAHAVKGARDA